MENYLHFNRAPALEPMVGAHPYVRNGNQTMVAKPYALPPAGGPGLMGGGMTPMGPMMGGGPPSGFNGGNMTMGAPQMYGPNGGPGPYPYFSPVVDHDRRMMRTNMIA